jgi:quercetin dioxygenase-like cupin family protein
VARTGAEDDGERLAAVGAAIRARRRARGLSLRDLSSLSGFSIGFLSQVERGKSSLVLTSLYKIAKALGSDVGDFFVTHDEPPHPLPHVTRSSEGRAARIENGTRTYKLLAGSAPERVLEPMLVSIEPTETIEEPYSHEGEEFAYVLSGRLTYVIAGEEYRLKAGDSIHIQSTVSHSVHNAGPAPALALWVLTPRLV